MPLFFKHQRAKPHMPWGAAVGAVVGSVANKALASGSSSGGGSQQSSSEPWAPAQPWMLQNIVSGTNLQNQLTANPFSPQQQAAYDNSYALNDYTRNLVPGLLSQLGGQQVGYDPSNPSARPDAWNWAGLLSDGAPDLGQRSLSTAQPAAAPAAAASGQTGDFKQQNVFGADDPNNTQGYKMSADTWKINPSFYDGGFGSFKYGMDVKPGTQEYRDMSEYLSRGGYDPANLYGGGSKPTSVSGAAGYFNQAGGA